MSEQSRRSILDELAKTAQAEQGIRDDNDFGGPAGSDVGVSRKLVGIVTAVFENNGRPTYSAEALDNPAISVLAEPPISRETNASVQIIAGKVGNECEFLRGSDDIWRLYWVLGDVMATADCQETAGIRNDSSVTIYTTTPTNTLPISADLVVADATAGDITFTLPESKAGKLVTVTNAVNTVNKVTVTNTYYGVSGVDILFGESVNFAYTGNTSIGWVSA